MIDTTKESRFSQKQLVVMYTLISLFCLLAVWEVVARDVYKRQMLRTVSIRGRSSARTGGIQAARPASSTPHTAASKKPPMMRPALKATVAQNPAVGNSLSLIHI